MCKDFDRGILYIFKAISQAVIKLFWPKVDAANCSGAHHSVATLLDAIAEPQPNVLKQLSMMLPSSST